MSKACDSCGEHLPDNQFADGSDDCALCLIDEYDAHPRRQAALEDGDEDGDEDEDEDGDE